MLQALHPSAPSLMLALGLALGLGIAPLGCDKSSEAPSPDAPPPADADGADPTSCAGYKATDACMDEDNFAQCQQMEAKCPGAVLAMESCPLQFACP